MCPEVVLVNTYLIFSKKAATRSNPPSPSQSNRLLIMGSPLKLFSCVTDPVTLSLSLSLSLSSHTLYIHLTLHFSYLYDVFFFFFLFVFLFQKHLHLLSLSKSSISFFFQSSLCYLLSIQVCFFSIFHSHSISTSVAFSKFSIRLIFNLPKQVTARFIFQSVTNEKMISSGVKAF